MDILSNSQSQIEAPQHLDLREQLITLFNRILDNNQSSNLVLNSDDDKQLEDLKVCFSDLYQQFIEAHLKSWSHSTLCSSIPTVRFNDLKFNFVSTVRFNGLGKPSLLIKSSRNSGRLERTGIFMTQL